MSPGTRISIGLNVVLLAALLWQWRTGQTPRPVLVNSPAPPKNVATSATSGRAPAPPVNVGGGWQSWIEPLRSAGVPTDVLAGLVQADFDRRWQPRQAEMQQKYLHGDIDSDALAAFAVEHDIDSDRELAAALGPAGYRRWDMDRVLKELPPAAASLAGTERDTVYELESNLRTQLRHAELDKLRGAIDQATLTQRQQQARDAVSAKLRELLGATRAAQLQAVDDTEGNLRRELRGTGVTGSQLQTLAAAQRDWDRKRSALVQRQTETDNAAYGELSAAATDKFDTAFEQIAGPRALDQALERSDNRYNELQRFARDWKLSSDDVSEVYRAIATIDGAVREYQNDAAARGVDADAQAAAIRGLQRLTLTTLTAKLGADRIATLQRNGILPVAADK